jgi:hypothetical protein
VTLVRARRPKLDHRQPDLVTIALGYARYQRCELVRSLARQLGIQLLFLPS